MNKEVYNEKRLNFKSKVETLFKYLVDEYNYVSSYKEHKQPNGFVTSDIFIYKNANRIINISNNYHPNDYGFELEIIDSSQRSSNVLRKKLVFMVLKKRQCVDQKYLNVKSKELKTKYEDILTGKKFFDDAIQYSITKSKKPNQIKVILLWIIGVTLLFFIQKIFKKT